MKTLSATLAAGLVAACIHAFPALAQQDEAPRGEPQAQSEQGAREVNLEQAALTSPEDLEGLKVVSSDGNEIGEVQKTVMKRGSTDLYLVISSDEFLGLGSDDAVVPLQGLRLQDEETLLLDSQDNVELFIAEDFLELRVAG